MLDCVLSKVFWSLNYHSFTIWLPWKRGCNYLRGGQSTGQKASNPTWLVSFKRHRDTGESVEWQKRQRLACSMASASHGTPRIVENHQSLGRSGEFSLQFLGGNMALLTPGLFADSLQNFRQYQVFLALSHPFCGNWQWRS